MCGIVAYLCTKDAYPILIKGLKRLEYRGYDSAGVALMDVNGIRTYKKQGKVSELENFAAAQDISGTIGIGHTRWATHGEPNDVNAHPHKGSALGDLVIVHNGIIENYDVLRDGLKQRGHVFESETDTEVLAHLIDDVRKKENVDLEQAVRIALTSVIGAYAIVVLSKDEPQRMVAARKSSPLVVGIGENNEFYLASDATPIIEYTKNVVYLEDEEIAVVDRQKGLKIIDIRNQEHTPYIQELEMELEAL